MLHSIPRISRLHRGSSRYANLALLSALVVATVCSSQPQPAHAAVTELDSRLELGKSEVPVRQWFDTSVRTKAIVVNRARRRAPQRNIPDARLKTWRAKVISL